MKATYFPTELKKHFQDVDAAEYLKVENNNILIYFQRNRSINATQK
jgi:hypothetical protein